jgi:hypothetical protein
MHIRRSIFAKLYKRGQRLQLKLYRMWHWTVRQSAIGGWSGYTEILHKLATLLEGLSEDDASEIVKSTFHKIATASVG